MEFQSFRSFRVSRHVLKFWQVAKFQEFQEFQWLLEFKKVEEDSKFQEFQSFKACLGIFGKMRSFEVSRVAGVSMALGV